MSITDELREWAEEFWEFAYSKFGDKSKLLAIADRIDAEHEDAVRKKAARMLTKTSEYMNDDDLAEIGLVRLPKDADGVPIRVGDGVMHKSLAKPVVVVGVGSDDFFYQKGASFNWFFHAHEVRHYHAPTVEDVLFESLRHFGAVEERTPEVDAWLHEQAKRLKLAGDAS